MRHLPISAEQTGRRIEQEPGDWQANNPEAPSDFFQGRHFPGLQAPQSAKHQNDPNPRHHPDVGICNGDQLEGQKISKEAHVGFWRL